MSYLLTRYVLADGQHLCWLSRRDGGRLERIVAARLNDRELAAFIQMCRKLDPETQVIYGRDAARFSLIRAARC